MPPFARQLWVMLQKTNNFAVGNAANLMLCHSMWRTAANTCSSTFRSQASEVGLAAMWELVVERPATISVCMEPPSTTHAGDCMLGGSSASLRGLEARNFERAMV